MFPRWIARLMAPRLVDYDRLARAMADARPLYGDVTASKDGPDV